MWGRGTFGDIGEWHSRAWLASARNVSGCGQGPEAGCCLVIRPRFDVAFCSDQKGNYFNS